MSVCEKGTQPMTWLLISRVTFSTYLYYKMLFMIQGRLFIIIGDIFYFYWKVQEYSNNIQHRICGSIKLRTTEAFSLHQRNTTSSLCHLASGTQQDVCGDWGHFKLWWCFQWWEPWLWYPTSVRCTCEGVRGIAEGWLGILIASPCSLPEIRTGTMGPATVPCSAAGDVVVVEVDWSLCAQTASCLFVPAIHPLHGPPTLTWLL